MFAFCLLAAAKKWTKKKTIPFLYLNRQNILSPQSFCLESPFPFFHVASPLGFSPAVTSDRHYPRA